ncbi:MAG TPA: PA14 domain-containing protein, partial [Cytophagaceae bacterium]
MKTELSLLFLIVTMYCRAQTPQNYTTFEGVNLSLYKYEGAKTMVLANSNSLDAATMTKWVNAMDGTYNFYESATGRQPSVNSATYINNRSTLAKVDKTCGAGCGYLGATGIELQADYFDDFYYDLLNYNQYSQEPFYEFGRNFWFYFNKLDYTSNDPIVTGYAVFMRFMAMEHLGLQGANFNSWTFTQFKDNVKGLLATYMGDPSLNWNNTLGVGQGIPGSSLGATDLFASFCWYLRDTYGETWVQNVWKHAGERPDRLTTQDAVDNFIIASSLAAKVNLTSLFQTWKWPISNDAINYLSTVDYKNYRNADNPANTVSGIDFKYYEGDSWSKVPDYSVLTPVKSGVDTNFVLTSRNRNDNFGYSYSSYINIPADGNYTFYTSSDDGSKLYIGTQLVVDNDGLHGSQERSGSIGLKAGKHAINVDFFERGGGELLEVSYSSSTISKRKIRGNELFRIQAPTNRNPENPTTVVNGLSYKYYEGLDWSTIPNFSSLNSLAEGNIENFSLATRKRDDNFGYAFTGYIEVPTDGSYTFYTNSDDGSKLYIGTTLVVNNDGLHADIEKSGVIGLKAGKHAIRVDFFERGGGEVLGVKYEGPGISKQAIPSNKLYRTGGPSLRDSENPGSVTSGLTYKYFEGTGWSTVENFASLSPIKTGTLANFSLAQRNRSDDFGIEFNGYIKIPAD